MPRFLLIADLRFPLDGAVRLHFSSGSGTRLGVADAPAAKISVESSAGQ